MHQVMSNHMQEAEMDQEGGQEPVKPGKQPCMWCTAVAVSVPA